MWPPRQLKTKSDQVSTKIKRPSFPIRDPTDIEFGYRSDPFLNFVFFVFRMIFVRDFTFTKSKAFADYVLDISQKSARHIRATVTNYDETSVYSFMKMFKNNGEFKGKRRRVHPRAKNQLHPGKN